MMEQDAAPAGRLRKPALGRRRGSARRPLGAAREELADGGRLGRPGKTPARQSGHRKRGPAPE